MSSIEQAEFLLDKLQEEFPCYEINFDLEDCDNILRVESVGTNIDSEMVILIMEKHGAKIQILWLFSGRNGLTIQRRCTQRQKENNIAYIYT